ncbi:TIGR02266 family protein [Vulgatibacter sp.]|uniref:PilZ domain-containing protein n=1 Tax=Vulgatibacter sp. TaxID=1971226 RepID=UPI003561961E
MSDNSQDRRRVARIPIALRLEYRRMEAFFAEYTKNLSRGGTFVKTPRPLPVGTRFSFLLGVPGREEPFSLQGEVVWTKATPPDAGMGVRFLWVDEPARQAFEAAVEGMMRETLGPEAAARFLAGEGYERDE